MKTHTLTWTHTRKGTPMTAQGTMGQLMVKVMMVRSVYPGYPMWIDGKPV